MYSNNRLSAYKTNNVNTADRGKLVLMIYDHCIKHSKQAIEAINTGNLELRTKSLFKAQDGITELMCSLDYEKGGDVAKNLYRLYDFYNRHLTEANLKNSATHVEDVLKMMQELRTAWTVAIDNVRKNPDINMRMEQKSYVSLVG
jgi:flagellar secretion chaperone FliS